MSANPDTVTKRPSGVKTSLITLPIPTALLLWCGKILWPWLTEQAESLMTGNWPTFSVGSTEQFLALILLPVVPVLWFVAYFLLNVWREIERDQKIYKVVASKIAAFPAAAWDLCGRWKDTVTGWIGLRLSWISFTRRYLRELPRLRKVLDVRNLVMTQANHLELEDVYIELKAASRTLGRHSAANPVTRELRNERAAIWDHLRVLRSGVALAIIGAPGSGKTTLLKHLMLKYAWNQQGKFRVRSRVPFFIELRKLPKLLGKGNASLPVVLANVLKGEHDLKPLLACMPNDWLSRLLKQGRCLLLCDGLDEVPDVTTRQMVSKWLDDQINHTDWHRNLFLVTARPAGYDSAPLGNVQSLEVQPFDWEDTRSFIQRWYMANRVITMKPGTPKRDIRDLAAQDADSLLKKLRDHTRLGVLTSNPLLLTMVCLMHEMGQLPGSRSQLYKEICEVHLERWRRRIGSDTDGKASQRETWNAEQKLTVLRPLARILMLRGELSVSPGEMDSKRLSTAEMLKFARESLDHIGVAADETSRRAFFTNLHHESGLWLELEPDEWGFAHLSFQEYLCADLWFTNPSMVPDKEEWPLYFEQSWWRECLLLYASKTTDLRPMVRAALEAKTPRSLAFLFALEGETVSIPADLQRQVDAELNKALNSKEIAIFTPAAEAWLLRQQEMGYSRIDERREVGSWVSHAEYQLFLLENDKHDIGLWPLHRIGKWFEDEARAAVAGMRCAAAKRYCNWLDQRFPEWNHRLCGVDVLERQSLLSDGVESTWLDNEGLNISSEQLKSRANILDIDGRLIARADALSITVAVAMELARAPAMAFDIVLDIALARPLFPTRKRVRTLALDHDRAIDLDRAIERKQELELDFELELDRALDRALNQLERNLDDVSIEKWQSAEKLIAKHCEPIKNYKWRVFRPLHRLWHPETTKFDAPLIYRRFLVACFEMIRQLDTRLITSELQPLEDLVRLLIDREEGKAPAWEGIRVIRERRA